MVVGLVAILSTARAADHTKDTPQDVKKAVAGGKAVLLDVREKGNGTRDISRTPSSCF